MAPRNKYTREEMINAAVRVVREKGAEGLTAKSVAEELNVSTQPVFTYFNTMAALKSEVRIAAERLFDDYTAEGLGEKIPFLGFGKQYIMFARDEPQLYRLLFLTRDTSDTDGAVTVMEHSMNVVREPIMRIYGISVDDADRYFRDMWLVVHSLATLIVTGECPYTGDQIDSILSGFSLAVLNAIKNIPHFSDGGYDKDAEFKRLIGMPNGALCK